jgi:hypothetical protein
VRHQPAPNYTQSYTPNIGDRTEQHVQPMGSKKNEQRKFKTDSDWPKSENDNLESGERPLESGERPLESGERPLESRERPLDSGERPLESGEGESAQGYTYI